jgi:thiamine transporter ThiT
MRKLFIQILTIAAITFAGTAGAVVVGLLVYGSNVFNMESPGFSFVSFGLSGALIFAFYHVRGLSEAITASVIASCVQFIAGSAYITMLRAIIFSFGLNIPVVALAFVFERKLAAHQRIKFAVVSLIYGAMFVILTLLAEAVSGGAGLPATTFRENFVDGLLLGLGLGLGLEAGEALLYSFEKLAAGKPAA